ncbi:MAG TPA: hypothetical protein VGS19_34790 [Streptosporangiaceae bacterium]|nr:hypothetical protein [Streptosporangiaceae bacterium]
MAATGHSEPLQQRMAARTTAFMAEVVDDLARLVAIPSVARAGYPPVSVHQAAGQNRCAAAPQRRAGRAPDVRAGRVSGRGGQRCWPAQILGSAALRALRRASGGAG